MALLHTLMLNHTAIGLDQPCSMGHDQATSRMMFHPQNYFFLKWSSQLQTRIFNVLMDQCYQFVLKTPSFP